MTKSGILSTLSKVTFSVSGKLQNSLLDTYDLEYTYLYPPPGNLASLNSGIGLPDHGYAEIPA